MVAPDVLTVVTGVGIVCWESVHMDLFSAAGRVIGWERGCGAWVRRWGEVSITFMPSFVPWYLVLTAVTGVVNVCLGRVYAWL
jgi:hypothetical protein